MDREKKVDESWKESAAKEKEALNKAGGDPSSQHSVHDMHGQQAVQEPSAPEEDTSQAEAAPENAEQPEGLELTFLNYISSLVYQVMIFLGEVANPMTNEIDRNVDQAKFLIDTLVLLREKTKGNLSKKEDDMLNASIYELQMRFIEVSKKDMPAEDESKPAS